MTKLSIIIISFNTSELTVNAINSIPEGLNNNPELIKQTEIIVVDNNSSDDSLKKIKALKKKILPKLILIENKSNKGFPKANNQGIKASTGEFILLLNSDTIVQPGALENLLKTMNTHPVNEETAHLKTSPQFDRLGILAADLQNPDGSHQPQGGDLPSLPALFFHMTMLYKLPIIGSLLPSTQKLYFNKNHRKLSGRLVNKGWVAATAMLIRKQVLEEISDLDQNIFMYGEDVEYCLRARKHHWDIAIDTSAIVTHLGSASSSKANSLKSELLSYIYIWSKHMPLWQLSLVKLFIKFGSLVRIFIFGTINRDTAKVKAYRQVLAEI